MSDDSEDGKSMKYYTIYICVTACLIFSSVLFVDEELRQELGKFWDQIKKVEIPDYMSPLRNNDFEAAHKALDKLYLIYQNDTQDDDIEKQYIAAERNVFSAEVRYLIAEKDPEEATKRIQFLLNEFMLIGEKPVAGENYDSSKCRPYILAVTAKNALCDQVLDLSIQTKNKALAELALSHYLDHPISNGKYKVVFESTDKDAAEKKYKEAIKRGAFQ